jgi:hypothetical protein
MLLDAVHFERQLTIRHPFKLPWPVARALGVNLHAAVA